MEENAHIRYILIVGVLIAPPTKALTWLDLARGLEDEHRSDVSVLVRLKNCKFLLFRSTKNSKMVLPKPEPDLKDSTLAAFSRSPFLVFSSM